MEKYASLDIFERVKKIKLSDGVKYDLESVLEKYNNMIKNLKYLEDGTSFPIKERNAFLKDLKNEDIKNNQIVENEDEYLINLYHYLQPNTVTDTLIKKNGEDVSLDEFTFYHQLLLKGTSSFDSREDYTRKNNDAFVGTYNVDMRTNKQYNVVDYKPINYKYIPKALELLVNYYNDKELKDENDILIKPFLFHAIVACLQLFQDGNTRFARVLQHIKIWNYTNQINTNQIKLKMPVLYLTEPYKLYRGQYREIIKDLVVEDTDSSWNKWLEFNLYRAEEALNYEQNNLNTLRKTISRYKKISKS